MYRYLLLILTFYWFATSAETLSITDERTGVRYPGKFVWTDLLTTDPGKAAAFYQGVFGW